MQELYWGCLILGVLFAVATVIFGDMLSNALDGMLDFMSGDHLHSFQPMVWVGGLTAFGGTGILLERYTGLHNATSLVLSILLAVLISCAVYFFYVKPMENTENSIGFSLHDLTGTIAEVTVPIPAAGYGEVIVKVGAAHTNQIAASFEGVEIEAGARVVTVEVKDHTLYVARLDKC